MEEPELARAAAHPRATERKRLGRYSEALRSVDAYASLPLHDRDAIVSWVALRLRLRDEHGIDNDPSNLADPLLPLDRLRAHVVAGELAAAGAAAPGAAASPTASSRASGEVLEEVRAIRSLRRS